MRRALTRVAKPARGKLHPTLQSTAPTGRDATPERRVFPVVGIGASAGGLDAFRKFFGAMPADGDVAFVLVQHLDPTRDSLTAELVGAHTAMPTVQVADGMRVEPNRIYVIPPNTYLSLHGG